MAAITTVPGVTDYHWLRDEPEARPGTHVQRVTVTWEYPLHFTRDVFSWENLTFVRAIARREPKRRHRLFVVVDEAVAAANDCLVDDVARYADFHRERLALVAPPLVVPGGERAKNDPALVERIHAELERHGLDRQSFVVIVGGGALQDAVGYAASTAHRGVRIVRVPTTVLAQADGGVGVKTAVNAFGKKNFLGTFAPPFAVIDDFDLLRSLPRRDAIAGMAEAIKVALVRDASFFGWIRLHTPTLALLDEGTVSQLVRRCALAHLDHMASAGDPFEMGSARPLDFGHWAAHRLEAITDHELRHGEAVAIGVALDTVYSAAIGLLDTDVVEPILDAIEALGLATHHPALDRESNGRRLVLEGLREFREHLGGELTVTLLERIGRGVEVHSIDEDVVLRAIDFLRHRATGHRCW